MEEHQDYTYSWNTGASTPDILDLGPGLYELTVTDANGCENISTIDLQSVFEFEASLSSIDVSCFNENDGQIIIDEILGGTSPYMLSLNGGASQNAEDILDLSAGTYTVEISDQNGCAVEETLIVNSPPQLFVDLTIFNPTCPGDTDGSILAEASGGNPGYEYSWSNNVNGPEIINIESGSFTITVVDNDGCEVVNTAFMDQLLPIEPNVSTFDLSCFNVQDGQLIIDTIIGGTAPYMISLNGGIPTSNLFLAGLEAGNYEIEVIDDNGCTFSETYLINQPEELVVELGDDEVIELGEAIRLTPFNNATTDSVFFFWEGLLDCIGCADTTIFPLNSGNIGVTLIDANGCQASDLLRVIVQKDRNIFFPECFFPEWRWAERCLYGFCRARCGSYQQLLRL